MVSSFNQKKSSGNSQFNKKTKTVTLSIAATIFSILYARGLTVSQLNVLGNLFQAMGEQMTTISAVVRAPFDEGEEDILINNYNRSQYFFIRNRLESIKEKLL